MVLTRVILRQMESVAIRIHDILQRILSVNSLLWEHRSLEEWQLALHQTMVYPTVTTLALSFYDVAAPLSVAVGSKYEPVWEHFGRWVEPFQTFDEIGWSVYVIYSYLRVIMDGPPPL